MYRHNKVNNLTIWLLKVTYEYIVYKKFRFNTYLTQNISVFVLETLVG
jgi:hypothetical protein